MFLPAVVDAEVGAEFLPFVMPLPAPLPFKNKPVIIF